MAGLDKNQGLEPVREGKTKRLERYPGTSIVRVQNMDIVSWDDKFKEAMPGKGAWSATTAANVFRLLERECIPTAFLERGDEAHVFNALETTMLPFEVVSRFSIEEMSSLRKRNPGLPAGPLDSPINELFLKTSERQFKGIELPSDDPYVGRIVPEGVYVHHPKRPLDGEGIFISAELLGIDGPVNETIEQVFKLQRRVSIALRDGWNRIGWKIGDYKAEYGYPVSGARKKPVVSDLIDNDSWRLRDDQGVEHSKQIIRDGMSVEEAAAHFALVAEKSECLAPG